MPQREERVMIRSRLIPLAAAAAFALLTGQVTDKTTGQPLHGVHVDVAAGHKTQHALTNAQGRFTFKNIAPGDRVLRLSSADVPPQKIPVTVKGSRQSIHVQVCSMTLDYSCGQGGGGGGS